MRDFQFHCPGEKVHDGRLELAAGDELEPRTVGAVVNEDADSCCITGSGSSMSSSSLWRTWAREGRVNSALTASHV